MNGGMGILHMAVTVTGCLEKTRLTYIYGTWSKKSNSATGSIFLSNTTARYTEIIDKNTTECHKTL